MITLHKVNHNNQHLLWSVERYSHNTIRIIWGVHAGAMQTKIDTVETNLSGRTMEEQIGLEMQSRANRQIDRGYRPTYDLALKCKGLNAANLLRPMLAKKYDGQSMKGRYFQYKYNGHRCLIHNTGDELIAYSRNGKTISTIDHILEQMEIPEGSTLDGELYIHGEALQIISSIVRRVQPRNKELTYVLFDQVLDKPFVDRFDSLMNYRLPKEVMLAVPEPHSENNVTNEMIRELAIDKGYEGFIARDNVKGYEPGVRSSQLIKLKTRFSDEFKVLNITESVDGWAILHCKFNTQSFRVLAPGTVTVKKYILDNKQEFIGKLVTIEYAELTKEGTPFHPVAIEFRDDL